MITAVIAAGGKGTRMGADINKVYLYLGGMQVIARTVSAFEKCDNIDEIIVVTGKNDIENFNKIIREYDFRKVAAVVCGGETRVDSVYNGLSHANGDMVLIHDGARALITEKEINDVIEDCKKYGAAALGVKCCDTLKYSENGFISGTANRDTVYRIQTPQAFYKKDIMLAHETAPDKNVTDDCALAEQLGIKIKITEGSGENIKLTSPPDMITATNILRWRYRNENPPKLKIKHLLED